MKLAIVGTGYVGLPTAVSFAEHAHEVYCIDNDAERISMLQDGISPIYEEGLQDAMRKRMEAGNLRFTTSYAEGLLGARAVFNAVGTPESPDGSANMGMFYDVADTVAAHIQDYTVFVNKSTVPVFTAQNTRNRIARIAGVDFDVVSNPEFMAEGTALEDVRKPSRIVVGTSSQRARAVMGELFRGYVRNGHPIRYMSEASAELSKLAANAMLATRVSFINSVATLSDMINDSGELEEGFDGVDVLDIAASMGDDPRIGSRFLRPGPGWGGSCFPKDTRSFISIAERYKYDLEIVRAVDRQNDLKIVEVADRVMSFAGSDLRGTRIAQWGLAFKKDTDDMRESPGIYVLDRLREEGASFASFDPLANPLASAALRERYADDDKVSFSRQQYEVLEGADLLLVTTASDIYTNPDLDRVKSLMKKPVIFDPCNVIDYESIKGKGFYYRGNGRPVIDELQAA